MRPSRSLRISSVANSSLIQQSLSACRVQTRLEPIPNDDPLLQGPSRVSAAAKLQSAQIDYTLTGLCASGLQLNPYHHPILIVILSEDTVQCHDHRYSRRYTVIVPNHNCIGCGSLKRTRSALQTACAWNRQNSRSRVSCFPPRRPG